MSKQSKGPRATMARGYNKTSVITVRLSPKHRYALDVLARMQRQTVSTVIEGLIRKEVGAALTSLDGGPVKDKDADRFARALLAGNTDAGSVLNMTWDPRECDRFVNIATYTPGLMTEDEELIWRLIRETPAFWKDGEVQREALRTQWDAVVRAARKGASSLRHLTNKE